ncbi:uncharacterized protein LOC134287082 [Aedes albopictus]|uniref:Zinc finger PHD-type domain-containing protein n=1 Tax=Aedes albopictus TaxID=7160 RepID=A0ABM1Z1R3_AEDAL
MASDAESTHDQTIMDLTATPCAICGPSTRDEVMVGCDGCAEWFHIRCVGIEEGKLPKKWYCQSKACQEKAQEYQQKQKDAKKQARTRKNGNESDKSSVSSRLASSSVEAKVRALEEKQKRQYEEMEAERLLQKKEREMQRAFEQRKMELELQMRAEEQEEQRTWQAEMLQKKKEQIQRLKANRESSFEMQMAAMDEELAELSRRKSKPALKVVKDVSRAGPSGKINKNVLKLRKANVKKLTRDYESTDGGDEDDEISDDSDLSTQSSDSSMEARARKSVPRKTCKKVGSVSQNGLGKQQTGPTKAQLAARMGLTYKLPKFSGKPAQWPLFYAAYKVSNDVCGYMNHENLMRLQEALEGDALELVSGQLLLPETIPQVIEKLRRHFGRPEQLLQCLLDKVNRLEPPRPDDLRSFVPFGNTVEQLCGHLEAADLRQHLVNPLLIKSLVAKLPDREKREWVHYRRGRGETTLRTLTDFLMDIVEDACEANVDVEFNPTPSPESDSQSEEESSNEAGLYCHCEASSSTYNASEESKLKPCKMCQSKDHRLQHCADFKKLRYDERLKLVTHEKLCHVCLNEHGGQCKFGIRCNIGDCRKSHHPLMHPVGNTVGLSAQIRANCTVLFRIVPVQLHCGDKTVSVLAFLDEGASVTLVEKKLADRLGAVGVQERLTIQWTGNMSRVEDSRRISLWASGTEAAAGGKMLLHTVHTVNNLMLPHQKLDSKELAAQYKYMRGLPIESYDGQPQLLIGANNIHAFAPIETKVGTPREPIAVRTKLGWTVYGPRQTTSAAAGNYFGYHRQIANDDLPPELFKSQFSLEESEVAIPRGKKKCVLKIRERTTPLAGDRCDTDLLSKARPAPRMLGVRHYRPGRTTTNIAILVPNARRQIEQHNRRVRNPKSAGSSTGPTRGEASDTGAFEPWHPADGEGKIPRSDLRPKWGPAFSTRHRGEFLPYLYKGKRSTRRLVASGAKPEEVKIDQRKKCGVMCALDEGRKLPSGILSMTLPEAAGNGSTISNRSKSVIIRGRREIPEFLEIELYRCGHQGLRWTSSIDQREDVDGKVQRRDVVKFAALESKVNPEMPDVTGWGVATPLLNKIF